MFPRPSSTVVRLLQPLELHGSSMGTSQGHGVGSSGVSGWHGACVLQRRGVGAFQGHMMDAPPGRGIVTFSGRGIVSLPRRGVGAFPGGIAGTWKFYFARTWDRHTARRPLGAFLGRAILTSRGSGVGALRIMPRILCPPPSPPLVALQTMVQHQSWRAYYHYEQMDGVVALQSFVMPLAF
jgi:hypothetical protein